jgi:hypothetical protein
MEDEDMRGEVYCLKTESASSAAMLLQDLSPFSENTSAIWLQTSMPRCNIKF